MIPQIIKDGEERIRSLTRTVTTAENPPHSPRPQPNIRGPARTVTTTEDPPRPQPKIQPWKGVLATISAGVLTALSVAAAKKDKATKAKAMAMEAENQANAAKRNAEETNSAKAAREATNAAKAAKAAEEVAKKAAREAAEAAEAAKATKAAVKVAKKNPQLSLRSILTAALKGLKVGVKTRVYNQFNQIEKNLIRKG